jgi:UDP-N-acetylmuramate--alanine ligase
MRLNDQRLRALADSGALVHLVGVGGVGMEGLARLLMQLGCRVCGSDWEPSRALENLEADGVDVQAGHSADFVCDETSLVVFSAAVPRENPELSAARLLGIDTVSRARLVADLSHSFRTVAVAGTHGKTTTASMLFEILRESGCDPSHLIGGRKDGRALAGLGSGELLVLEADEYDRGFLHLKPWMALITNVEAEHLVDTYRSEEEVVNAFADFASGTHACGSLLINGDDPGCRAVSGRLAGKSVAAFGIDPSNEYRAGEIGLAAHGSRFRLSTDSRTGDAIEISVGVPGRHNVMNAAAAAAAAHSLGVDDEAIRSALSGFTGVERRFEIKGEAGGILVVEDYAHHPTEVGAAIEAARVMKRPVTAAFQPHLFTRTRVFLEQFAAALMAADRVFLTDVYGARESGAEGGNAGSLRDAMRQHGYEPVQYTPDKLDLPAAVAAACVPGDLVLFLGAGDIGEVAKRTVDLLARQTGSGTRP